MKALFLYLTIFVTLVTVFGAVDLFCTHFLLLLVFMTATALLWWVAVLCIDEEDLKKFLGWNLWCRIFKFSNEL